MRFLRHMIEKSMQNPEEVIAKERERIEKVQDGADALKRRWSSPLRSSGFWTFSANTGTFRERYAAVETNPISPYASAAKEIGDQGYGKSQ